HPVLSKVGNNHQVRCWRAEEWLGPKRIWAVEESAEPCVDREKESTQTLLQVKNMKVYYPVPFKTVKGFFGLEKRQYVHAVDGVSFSVNKGRTLGIVGESGCGKSSMARAIVGLEAIYDGKMEFLGLDITKPLIKRNIETIKQMQMVFQDPNSVLNPSYCVGDQIAFTLKRFRTVPRREIQREVERLLCSVKLDESYYYRMPRQLSGGEKQRIGIARAIASNPSLLICDEPVSALDVSVQAAVLNLLLEIQNSQNTTMVLISHDLSTVRFFSDDVAVMYLGRIMEIGDCEAIYQPPYHPYTAALLAAVPRPNPELKGTHVRLYGRVPSAINPPSGCRFHTRCPFKIGEICETEEPKLRQLGKHHFLACHLSDESLSIITP
ncbi:MAG: ABC transporter ATP-binding protein, partial [Anaerolineales bacterium]